MSLISDIFEGGAAGIFKGVASIITTIKADPLEIAKIQAALVQAELQFNTIMVQAQTKINEIEAASTNVFVAGWRPFIGWVCGSAFAYNFVLQPILVFIFAAAEHPVLPPHLEMAELMAVMSGILGLGAYRTYEKTQRMK